MSVRNKDKTIPKNKGNKSNKFFLAANDRDEDYEEEDECPNEDELEQDPEDPEDQQDCHFYRSSPPYQNRRGGWRRGN